MARPTQRTISFAVNGPIARDDLRGLCLRVCRLLERAGAAAAYCDVEGLAPDAVTVEATGNRDKLNALVRVLEPFGIKELVQSGIVGIGRGTRSITDRSLRPVGDGTRATERTA